MTAAEIEAVENVVLSCFNSSGNLAQDQYAIGRISEYFRKLRAQVEEPQQESRQ